MKDARETRGPKKALGQHFLVAQGIIEKICDWVCVDLSLPVVEIGPGRGALTEGLLARGCRVLALEIDRDLMGFLSQKFEKEISQKKLLLLNCDAAEITESDLFKKFIELEFSTPTNFIVCGNLPYNVGTQIVMNFLEGMQNAKRFVFMLQKEVVLRFLSEGDDSDYGPLAVKMAWLSRVIGKFWVKPGSFDPPPRVDSGVFCFERKTSLPPDLNPFSPESGIYAQASDFISKIFQNRRKMLRAIDKQFVDTPWGSKRPQEINPEELLALVRKLGRQD